MKRPKIPKPKYKLLNPDKYRVISLDIGEQHTGYAIWDKGELDTYGQIENPERDPTIKCYHMGKLVADLGKGKPSLFVVEDYAFGRGFFNMIQAETIGALKSLLLPTRFIGLIFLSPSTIKKHVTGSGRAKKGDVKKAVKNLGYICRSSHEADAIAVYLTYNKVWQAADEGVYKRAIMMRTEDGRSKITG